MPSPPPPPPASSPPTAPTFLCPLPPPILLSSPKLSSWMGPVFYLRPTQTAPEDQCQLHPLSKPSVEHQGSLLSKHPETSPCLSTLTIRALRSKLEKLSEKKEEQKLPKSYSSCRHTGPNTRSSTSKDPTSSSGSYSDTSSSSSDSSSSSSEEEGVGMMNLTHTMTLQTLNQILLTNISSTKRADLTSWTRTLSESSTFRESTPTGGHGILRDQFLACCSPLTAWGRSTTAVNLPSTTRWPPSLKTEF